jgi:hypothetical protein
LEEDEFEEELVGLFCGTAIEPKSIKGSFAKNQ